MHDVRRYTSQTSATTLRTAPTRDPSPATPNPSSPRGNTSRRSDVSGSKGRSASPRENLFSCASWALVRMWYEHGGFMVQREGLHTARPSAGGLFRRGVRSGSILLINSCPFDLLGGKSLTCSLVTSAAPTASNATSTRTRVHSKIL